MKKVTLLLSQRHVQGPGASAACLLKTVFVPRSEVSSSSSLDSPVQSAQQVSVQDLLHSQCLQTSEQDQQDCEILSSQQDLFEADKTGKCPLMLELLFFIKH